MYHNLVLSGGSLKGVAFVGCIKYLEEHNLLKSVNTFVGSSIGSIICFMACCGMTSKEMLSVFVSELQRYDKEYEINIEHILNIFNTLGFDNGAFFNTMFKRLLSKIFHDKDDITFIEFAKTTGKNLVICGSNITKHRCDYFCVDNTPDMSILTALRISISLPIIFTPVVYKNDVYVDAALFNNFPIDYLDKGDKLIDTIGIHITNKQHKVDTSNLNLLSYMKLLVDSSFYKMNEKARGSNNVIVNITFDDEDAYNFNIETLKFKMDTQMLKVYIEKGYQDIKHSFQQKP